VSARVGPGRKALACARACDAGMSRWAACIWWPSYQIAIKIKPLYLTHNTCYLTSNTTRVVQH
jgi:hypothetical protein